MGISIQQHTALRLGLETHIKSELQKPAETHIKSELQSCRSLITTTTTPIPLTYRKLIVVDYDDPFIAALHLGTIVNQAAMHLPPEFRTTHGDFRVAYTNIATIGRKLCNGAMLFRAYLISSTRHAQQRASAVPNTSRRNVTLRWQNHSPEETGTIYSNHALYRQGP